MARWLRLGGWALLAAGLLWLALEIVAFVFGIVSFLIGTAVSVLVAAVLLYLAYLLVSRVLAGGRTPDQRESERAWE